MTSLMLAPVADRAFPVQCDASWAAAATPRGQRGPQILLLELGGRLGASVGSDLRSERIPRYWWRNEPRRSSAGNASFEVSNGPLIELFEAAFSTQKGGSHRPSTICRNCEAQCARRGGSGRGRTCKAAARRNLAARRVARLRGRTRNLVRRYSSAIQ